MRRSIGWLVLIFPLCGLGPEATAAGMAPRVGDRVQVTTPSLTDRLAPALVDKKRISPFVTEKVLAGRLEAIDGVSLRLRPEGVDTSLSISMDDVSELAVWTPDDHRRTGTLLGLMGGAVLGGLMGHSFEKDDPPPERGSSEPCTSYFCDFDLDMHLDLSPSPTLVGVLAGGVIGAALGRRIGSTVPRDRWDPVDPGRLHARFTAGPGDGFELVLQAPFERAEPMPGRQPRRAQ